MAKKATRKSARKTSKRAAKRTLVAPKGDKRYVRRGTAGRFSESDDVGKAAASDRRQKATRKSKPGQGDRGDREAR